MSAASEVTPEPDKPQGTIAENESRELLTLSANPWIATRWWIWVCPTGDFKGRLHVAGYAIERHALYTVCDTHGDTFLR